MATDETKCVTCGGTGYERVDGGPGIDAKGPCSGCRPDAAAGVPGAVPAPAPAPSPRCTCAWTADFADHGEALRGPHHSKGCPMFAPAPSPRTEPRCANCGATGGVSHAPDGTPFFCCPNCGPNSSQASRTDAEDPWRVIAAVASGKHPFAGCPAEKDDSETCWCSWPASAREVAAALRSRVEALEDALRGLYAATDGLHLDLSNDYLCGLDWPTVTHRREDYDAVFAALAAARAALPKGTE